jgi:hypothetical protein
MCDYRKAAADARMDRTTGGPGGLLAPGRTAGERRLADLRLRLSRIVRRAHDARAR